MTFSINLYKVKKKYNSTLRMITTATLDETLSKLERRIERKLKSKMTHIEGQCVTLDERVNLEAVKYLMSMPKARWKSILSTDTNRKFEAEHNKLKAFLYGQLNGTGITRTYKFADGKKFGRQFDHSGLQGMPRWCADRRHMFAWQDVSFLANRTHV